MNDDIIAISNELSTIADDLLNRPRLDLAALHVDRLRQLVGLLDYHTRYGERRGIARGEVSAASSYELVARRCGIEGCRSPLPYFNLNNTQHGEAVWRCLVHIPSFIAFPIGLHGDEWAATGRTPVVWRAGR